MNFLARYDRRDVEAFSALNLTPREAEVLFWISQGKSNRDIGVILGAKTGTVCKHVEHIFGKLNVENRTSAAMVALEASHSSGAASESNSGSSWGAVAGIVATQFGQLWSGAHEAFPFLIA